MTNTEIVNVIKLILSIDNKCIVEKTRKDLILPYDYVFFHKLDEPKNDFNDIQSQLGFQLAQNKNALNPDIIAIYNPSLQGMYSAI